MGALLLVFAVGPWFADEPLPQGAIARLGTGRFWVDDDWGETKAVLSPDGQTFACAARGGVALMDARSGVVSRTVACGDVTRPIRFLDDGRKLAVSGTGVEVWDLRSEVLVGRWEGEYLDPDDISFSSDGTLAARVLRGADRLTVVVRDLRRNRDVIRLRPLPNHWAWTALSPDGRTVVTGGIHLGDDGTVKGRTVQVWDVATGEERYRFRCKATSDQAAFTPDGTAILVLCGNNWIEAREPGTGTLRWRARVRRRERQNVRLAFSPDGRRVAVMVSSGRVSVHELSSGKEVERFAECDEGEGVGYGPGGQVMTWQGRGRILGVRDRVTGRLLTPSARYAPIYALAFDPTGRLLHSFDELGGLATWDANRRANVLAVDLSKRVGPNDGMTSFHLRGRPSFSPRGDRLAVPTWTSGPAVFDTRTGREVTSVRLRPGDEKYSWWTEFLADGRGLTLVALPDEKTAGYRVPYSVGDASTGKERRRFVPDLECTSSWTFNAGAVSPDGRYAALVASEERSDEAELLRFTTWDLMTGKALADVRFDGAAVFHTALTVAPDNRSALLILNTGEMQIRDLLSGRVLRSIAGRGLAIISPVFSPGGRTFGVVAGTGAGSGPVTVSVYERVTGRERSVRVFERHRATALAYSADGGTLATGHDDGTILLWPTAGRAPGQTMEQLWRDLHGDAPTAGVAIDELVARPREAESLFRAKVRRDQPLRPTREQVQRLIDGLDSGDYETRNQSFIRLAEWRFAVEDEVRDAMRGVDIELRLRCRRLLAALDRPTAKEIAQTRYVEVLERIGAMDMLQELGRGDLFSVLTREARATLDRRAR